MTFEALINKVRAVPPHYPLIFRLAIHESSIFNLWAGKITPTTLEECQQNFGFFDYAILEKSCM